jgi:putative restriction endonuclease
VLGARLDDALFDMFLNEEERDSLRRVLIETYFAPDIRPQLIEVGQITAESFEYSRGLLDRSRERFKLKEAPQVEQQYRAEARSAAFRRVVVDAYNHTCALCGVRIVTPEGRTAVAAAHIVPWRVSHNDDPRNGMALCGLHHWTFDQGIVSVGTGYQIEVSPTVPRNEKAVEPLLELAMAMLHRPADPGLWPARDALEWHRKNVFRAELPPRLLG